MTNKRKIIITKGLPGSGKSTFARAYITQHPNYKIISRDSLRAMLDDSQWSEKREKFIRKSRNTLMMLAFESGYNVVLDETFLIPGNQNQILDLIDEIERELDIQIETIIEDFTDVPVGECIRRDGLRTGSARVGEKVIKDFYVKYVSSNNEK